MVNPFNELKRQHLAQKIHEEGWEEIEGALQCQKGDCRETVTSGLYSATAKVLTWQCSKGHMSRMENFVA